ncbi:MAG: lysophospholipid acyltransferase family protein [Eubacteriales bacterium]|nr:lysophospholipid acyltransferase family protein [Eubacteriales bacterium]
MNKKKDRRIVWLAKRTIQYILLGIYKTTYGFYIRKKYRLKLTPDSDVNNKGPYLLLANHCNSFDGLFLQCLLSRPIHFVITDTVFKSRALGGLMSLVGYIPKKKFVSDIRAIRQIIRSTRNGGIVGIFPEGRRSWDGKTVHISKPTYKLIQMLKIPVVTAKIKGSYLSEPRWANTKRYGLVEVELKTLLDAESLPRMNLAEIEQKITQALEHNEFDWQQNKKIPFKGKALAEGFERLLFTCPECNAIGTMKSADDKVWCTSCGSEYCLDAYGYIHSKKGYLPTENIIDLNRWQLERLRLSRSQLKKNEDVFLSDEDACLSSTMSLKEPFRELERGKLLLTLNELIIGSMRFNLADLYGISVVFKSHLSFRCKSCDYKIGFADKCVSVYKWYEALQFITDAI